MRVGAVLAVCALVLSAGVVSPLPSKSLRSLVTIDGHDTTIAQATSEQIDGTDVAISVLELVLSIVEALNAEEFDYWGNVKDEVAALVGSYINEHNMNQVEAYEQDLEKLLLRYVEAPVASDNYPDKNQQASALSAAIISHRYLVMSGDLRFSLILHFEDIASMHIVVLKDAAETYSVEDKPSQWWVDLDGVLEDYIAYSSTVTEELRDWRMGMITCTVETNTCRKRQGDEPRVCYDIYTVTDGVTEEVSTCKQVAGATGCTNHCQTYSSHRLGEVDVFVGVKVTSVTDVWRELKLLSEEMAAGASPYYEPARHL